MSSRLKRCPNPKCHTLIPLSAKACKDHLHLCVRCHVKESITPQQYYDADCKVIVNAEIRDRANAKSNEKLKAQRKANPVMAPCRCGCGVMVKHPAKWSPDCREASAKAIYAASLERERLKRLEVAAKKTATEPTKESPPVFLTDEEQAEINEESIRREAARVDRIHREMGLVVRSGHPLASDLIPVSPEEMKRLEAIYQPPQRAAGMWLPWLVTGA